jgi:hypothetical protein
MKNKRIIAGLAGLAIAGIGIAGCKSSAPAAAPPAPAASTSAPAATTSAPAVATQPAAPVTTAPAAPAMSTAEQQAVDSAQSYLAMGQGFSKAGLLNQLTSSAGAGFAVADANFAISYLNPNWNAQAVESAKGYLAMGQGFSKAGLLNQLTSSSGGGFTDADANFAISYLDPNWNAQAVESAKGYLAMGGFSRASLIQQLTSSSGGGFTEAQAEYAVAKAGL